MASTKELFNKLARKFLKTFLDYEREIYKTDVIDKIDSETFQRIYDEIIWDDKIKYFPKPIEFERLAWKLKEKKKPEKEEYQPTPESEAAKKDFIKNFGKMLDDIRVKELKQ